MKYSNKIIHSLRQLYSKIFSYLFADVYFGKRLTGVSNGSIVFFPCRANMLCCGLAGIVSIKNKNEKEHRVDMAAINDMVQKIDSRRFESCIKDDHSLNRHYLCGQDAITSLLQEVQKLKGDDLFCEIFNSHKIQTDILKLSEQLSGIIHIEEKSLSENMGHLNPDAVDTMALRIDILRDIAWCLKVEIIDNIKKVGNLFQSTSSPFIPSSVKIFKKINTVLNSIDRLEVRGRDSAGLSLMFILKKTEFKRFKKVLGDKNLLKDLKERSSMDVLNNMDISINKIKSDRGKKSVAIAITYKIAAEIGSLGDNMRFLRKQIKNDPVLQILVTFPHQYHTVSSHTRWASVGAITEANCHPIDNEIKGNQTQKSCIIHVCLNGDIDNYMELKKEYERKGNLIHEDITTDTKIIPLQIEKYIKGGFDVGESFRLAVNDFEGSHAISMHTDLAPGKLFLAQKGSGQAIFIGLAENHFMPASEVYGFIEETQKYLKVNGEKILEGKNGSTQGQIFILDQESKGGLDGISAIYYDGTPVELSENEIKTTEITSRDIDRQEFPHYFLKEISESSVSVEKTLQNRWKFKDSHQQIYKIGLDENTIPESIQKALMENQIQRIFFIGQGTAGVAALACANILNYYMGDPSLHVNALKASELSGFQLNETDDANSMADALVIAISQSGTTTDTNRTIDMVKERGAHTIAIVNRRDSDITFKVDGVMYTSSGRDIEMSVASTKAFYSQIVAGAILSLRVAKLKGCRNEKFISEEIQRLLELPSHMKKILAMRSKIEKSAKQLAVTKTYWAAVGSGPNKASADEIRIKLSELCYKTISSDFVEDKKHIDLSSEPLIIVCAAGTRGTVIGDIIKDTAIFKAHKATPIVIANEGEIRFNPYAADVFLVPVVNEHLSPIVNTLVGHLWGYYAALAINESSGFLHKFREEIQNTVNEHVEKGLDIYEVILEKSFKEKTAAFYNEFIRKKTQNRFPVAMGQEAFSDLVLLLKYLSDRLPVSDFELDFGIKGTAMNMLNKLFECLGESINKMARPVDAIKHQAKTVTVGTSRISEKIEGILFESLTAHHVNISQITGKNILVLKNLQGIISSIKGSIFYKIGGLNLLGELSDETTIEVIKKNGVLEPIPSRVEKDSQLKGSKRIIVQEGNVYIGKGRKDDRSILIIPIISTSPRTPNIIEYLLLLNVFFKKNVPLFEKIKALGGKYERVKNIVQENSMGWDDKHLELIEIEELFGRSAEKIGEYIVSQLA